MTPIVDGHLDIAINALAFDRDLTSSLGEINNTEKHLRDHPSRGRSVVSIPAMRDAGILFCVASLLARVSSSAIPREGRSRLNIDHSTPASAYSAARAQLAYYELLDSAGELKLLRNKQDLVDHCGDERPKKRVGIVLSLEGSDPIVRPKQTEEWQRLGLRVASLSHYGNGRYAGGTGTDKPISESGKELLRSFQSTGIILDVTHLSERAFFEALDLYSGPVLASHNNCRGIVPGDRQFSDEQLNKLLARKAVIGIALDAWMLSRDWMRGKSSREGVSLETVADHIDRISQMAGNSDNVAIGSDLDGGFGSEQTPREINSIADIHLLEDVLTRRGYSETDVKAIFYKNWLNFFSETLPDQR